MDEDIPTVVPKDPMEVADEVEALRDAMKGLGTDEDEIIRILTSYTSNQRQIVKEFYDTSLERDLIHDLKRELRGEFEDITMDLMKPQNQYLAEELRHALKDKNGPVIVQILCTYKTIKIELIKNAYETLFEGEESLEELVEDKTEGVFQRIILGILATERGFDFDEDGCLERATKIHNDGELDEDELVDLLTTASFQQIKRTIVAYYAVAGKPLGETIESIYEDDMLTNMKAVFDCFENRYVFFAEELKQCTEGIGTKDRDLTRIVLTRCEDDLGNIKEEYQTRFEDSLAHDIRKDTSGDYKKVLLALLIEL